jgi:glycogen(starch) synthase
VRVLTVGNMYPPHHYGGYELIWQSAVNHLRAGGHDVRVVTTDTRTESTQPDEADIHRELRWHLRGGEFEPTPLSARLRTVRHNHGVLRRHLRDFRPDVVSWWSMGGLSLTLIEDVRRRAIPAVAFVIDEWLGYGRKADAWLRTFTGPRRSRLAPVAERLARVPASVDFAAAARYLFVSEFTRQRAIESGLHLPATGIARSGISVDFLDPAPEREWGWRLLYLGRIDPRKGIDTAVEALPELPTQATLTIVGGWDAAAEARLRQLAAQLGVEDRVVFAGHRDRPALIAAYGDADAVVFPVRWDEPWGLVPLEAMARGRPVVATGRGGSGEYLRHGENALLFEADDAGQLAAALQLLASDAPLRARLREGGLATAARYTEPGYNAEVEAALLEAAGLS